MIHQTNLIHQEQHHLGFIIYSGITSIYPELIYIPPMIFLNNFK